MTVNHGWGALALCVVLLYAPLGAITCPNGWTEFETSCYLILQFQFDWLRSKAACETAGGGLAEISSPEENVFVSDLLNRARGGEAWIGLYDFVVEQSFLLVSTRSEPEYTHWDQGQPSDYYGEDCGTIRSNGFWNDAGCEQGLWAICEMREDQVDVIG